MRVRPLEVDGIWMAATYPMITGAKLSVVLRTAFKPQDSVRRCNMEDDGGSSETYEEQISRRRRMSSVVLPYRQRIGIGLVIISLLILFGGLVVRGF